MDRCSPAYRHKTLSPRWKPCCDRPTESRRSLRILSLRPYINFCPLPSLSFSYTAHTISTHSHGPKSRRHVLLRSSRKLDRGTRGGNQSCPPGRSRPRSTRPSIRSNGRSRLSLRPPPWPCIPRHHISCHRLRLPVWPFLVSPRTLSHQHAIARHVPHKLLLRLQRELDPYCRKHECSH